jgi:hypothetical protein
MSITGSGNGSGHADLVEVDAVKCDRGYTLKVGETFDPNRAWVLEVKCAKDGSVDPKQKLALENVTSGGRKWQRVVANRIWVADDGGKWVTNAKFAYAAAAFAAVGAARTAWACVHADEYDDDLRYVVACATNYQIMKDRGDQSDMEMSMQQLMEAIREYISNFTDHPAVNLVISFKAIDRYFGEPP